MRTINEYINLSDKEVDVVIKKIKNPNNYPIISLFYLIRNDYSFKLNQRYVRVNDVIETKRIIKKIIQTPNFDRFILD
jgi:CRISPR/Cas system CSM-associated protein Csm4 (group 5 of RAMP superfamily)